MGFLNFISKKRKVKCHCDHLSSDVIKLNLNSPHNVEVFDEIDSTNTYLKSCDKGLKKDFTIVVSDSQTQGRGRINRQFYSPKGSGIYLSILLYPNLSASDCVFLTTAACVAVTRAIKDCLGLDTQIKWVNDIYCKGKKLCGILTESSVDASSGKLNFAVVGIGINFKKSSFPKEISRIATSLEDCVKLKCDRNTLISSIINHFESIYLKLPNREFMNEYQKRSFLVGKNVTVFQGEVCYDAVVKSVESNANLVVEKENGETVSLFSGEVSLKIK